MKIPRNWDSYWFYAAPVSVVFCAMVLMMFLFNLSERVSANAADNLWQQIHMRDGHYAKCDVPPCDEPGIPPVSHEAMHRAITATDGALESVERQYLDHLGMCGESAVKEGE